MTDCNSGDVRSWLLFYLPFIFLVSRSSYLYTNVLRRLLWYSCTAALFFIVPRECIATRNDCVYAGFGSWSWRLKTAAWKAPSVASRASVLRWTLTFSFCFFFLGVNFEFLHVKPVLQDSRKEGLPKPPLPRRTALQENSLDLSAVCAAALWV